MVLFAAWICDSQNNELRTQIHCTKGLLAQIQLNRIAIHIIRAVVDVGGCQSRYTVGIEIDCRGFTDGRWGVIDGIHRDRDRRRIACAITIDRRVDDCIRSIEIVVGRVNEIPIEDDVPAVLRGCIDPGCNCITVRIAVVHENVRKWNRKTCVFIGRERVINRYRRIVDFGFKTAVSHLCL